MSYIITNDDYKPSLMDEEALEHYGIKGMKWGVRRDQRELDRAAGRHLNPGKKRSAQIKTARNSVKRAQAKISTAENRLDEAKTPEEKAAAQKKFEQAMKDFDNNPKRSIAVKVTAGEAAAIWVVSAMTLPVSALAVTGAVVGVAGARTTYIRKQQRDADKS